MNESTLYGLTVATDFEVPDAPPSHGGPEIVIRNGPPQDRWPTPPEGDVLLALEVEGRPDEPWHRLVRAPDGRLHFRMSSLGEAVISEDLSDMRLTLSSDAPPDLASVLTTGNLLSVLLPLKGSPVFHGSAVEIDGEAIAFVGDSGQGKTTTATLFCAEGAAVVTDDVLVIDDAETVPTVRRGPRGLRLRAAVSELGATISDAEISRSADDRHVVTPRQTASARVPLKAIVIPHPEHEGSPVRFELLNRKQGALALLSYPRLVGWKSPSVVSTTFRIATQTTMRVPVLVAHIPWGPQFPEHLMRDLFDFLDDRAGLE